MKALNYHYYDEKGCIQHRSNLMQLESNLDVPTVIAFRNMCRALARCMTLNIGWINYEGELENYDAVGGCIGNQYHSRMHCYALINYYFTDVCIYLFGFVMCYEVVCCFK